MKYRKKPVVIEAIYWNGTEKNLEQIEALSTERLVTLTDQGELEIHTLEGVMSARIGDFIIKGVKGEIYPCKPDIFEATYEKV